MLELSEITTHIRSYVIYVIFPQKFYSSCRVLTMGFLVMKTTFATAKGRLLEIIFAQINTDFGNMKYNLFFPLMELTLCIRN